MKFSKRWFLCFIYFLHAWIYCVYASFISFTHEFTSLKEGIRNLCRYLSLAFNIHLVRMFQVYRLLEILDFSCNLKMSTCPLVGAIYYTLDPLQCTLHFLSQDVIMLISVKCDDFYVYGLVGWVDVQVLASGGLDPLWWMDMESPFRLHSQDVWFYFFGWLSLGGDNSHHVRHWCPR